MARLAYFYREMSEYIEIDLRLLRQRHDVVVTGCPSRWPRPVATWRTVAAADAVMAWFASWHALWPATCARLQGKPFVIVVGGYDTAALPGIAYGHQRGGLRRLVARAVLALATRVLAISEFTVREVRALGVPDDRVSLVPLGLDPERYDAGEERDPGLVVTVGGVNRSNLTRKGLEPFVRAAALLPQARFVVIGAWMDDAIAHLRTIATPNVHFTGRLSHGDKVDWLARAAAIVQPSQHEAFGLALAEGMLCGAVPVVTDAGALPWVAGDSGVVTASAAPEALAQAIARALALPADAGRRARARVLESFSLARRDAGLEAVLSAAGVRPGVPTTPTREVRRAA